MHRLSRLLGLLFAAVTLAPNLASAAVPTAYEIKGTFLYHFTHFVEWPAAAFAGTGSPFVIAVLDRDHVAPHIAEALAGKRTADRRPIRVVAISSFAALPPDCQILFVSDTVRVDWSELGRSIGSRPVLLVGESAGFAERGGMINFVTSGDHLGMEINYRRAVAAGLRLSGEMASSARIVRDKAE